MLKNKQWLINQLIITGNSYMDTLHAALHQDVLDHKPIVNDIKDAYKKTVRALIEKVWSEESILGANGHTVNIQPKEGLWKKIKQKFYLKMLRKEKQL